MGYYIYINDKFKACAPKREGIITLLSVYLKEDAALEQFQALNDEERKAHLAANPMVFSPHGLIAKIEIKTTPPEGWLSLPVANS